MRRPSPWCEWSRKLEARNTNTTHWKELTRFRISGDTQGTYRFDVDIPECPRKPYHTFHVFVERNAAPPPPTPSPPPPPFVNYIRVSFTTRFQLANYTALADQHDSIREEFVALLVAQSGIDRCVRAVLPFDVE